MLEAESMGLPSTSFEYVPVLIDMGTFREIRKEINSKIKKPVQLNMGIFGEFVTNSTELDSYVEDDWYLLTNLRAVLYDQKKYGIESVDFKTFFNESDEEQDIIRQNFKCFFTKTPIFVARQLVRHRLQMLQELSRRYTNNKTAPIEFYVKNNNFLMKIVYMLCLFIYTVLVKFKMKPEDARAILGTGMYTQIWSGWLNSGYDNYINLRTKKKTQQEFRELANTCVELVEENK